VNLFESIGIDASYIVILLFFIVGVMIVLYILLLKKFKEYKRNYDAFMTGSDAENLEQAILAKFIEVDEIKDIIAKHAETTQDQEAALKFAYQKFAINKYDAFGEMGGKLSFSLCMLTDNNDGFILTSVHSANEGSYIYIKEIIRGEAYLLLSEEEKKALDRAKERKSCLDD